MLPFFISLLVIIISFIAYNFKFLKKKYIQIKQKRLEDYFNLYNLLKEIKNYQKKETKIFFYCQTIVSNYYSKLNIFNQEYELNSNDPIEIQIKKTNKLKSDFTEKIILKSNSGDMKYFIINICYHMNNYYQIILDKIEDSLSLEIVFYSKNNQFPKCIKGNDFSFKNYDNKNIPFLKRYNIINISREEFYLIYNTYAFNKLEESSKLLLKDYNSLFINFIHKINEDNFEGKIYNQIEDKVFEDFNDDEIKLLNLTKKFISDNINNKDYLEDSFIKLIYTSYLFQINNFDSKLIKELLNKISTNYYFIKYFQNIPDNQLIEQIEAGFFIEFIINKNIYGIKLYMDYIKHKKNIFKNEDEFNNFEKLMILMTLYYLVPRQKIKFLRLYGCF